MAPVATDGMRPWSALKPWLYCKKVGRRLAGTADAAHLDRGIRIDPGRLARLDQVAGDAVVAAPLAQGRRQPLKGHGRQRERVAVALDLDHRIGGHG